MPSWILIFVCASGLGAHHSCYKKHEFREMSKKFKTAEKAESWMNKKKIYSPVSLTNGTEKRWCFWSLNPRVVDCNATSEEEQMKRICPSPSVVCWME